jgi:uncharacterized membrane protein YqjE
MDTREGIDPASAEVAELSTPQLISRLSEQTSVLVRDEVALAKAEIQETVRKVGLGAGLFGTAGVISLYGVGALVAAAILGLSTVLDAWLAAVIVAVVLFVVAGVAALLGRRKVAEGTPPLEATKENVKQDVATLKGSRS